MKAMLCICRAEYVIDAVLDQFREQNEICGDGQDGFLEDEQLPKDYNALPVCENDFDFKLLRQHLCNDGLMPNGPYYQVNDSSSDLGLQGGFYVNELAPADSSDEEDDDDDDDEKSSGEEDQDDDEVDDKGGLDGLD